MLYDCLCLGKSTNFPNDPEEDPFEQVARLIGQCLPEWVPRPIHATGSYRLAITTLSLTQSALGVRQMLTGDLYGGCYASLLGVLGFNTVRAEKHSELFKTYLVITFINGCVQGMEVFQLLVVGAPLASHLVTVIAPTVSGLAAYIGWQYVKRLRRPTEEYRARQLKIIEEVYDRLGTRLGPVAEECEDNEEKEPIPSPDANLPICDAPGGSGSPTCRGA